MRAYKVYKYTNKVNGKVYIGQTRQSIKDRAMGRGHGYKKCHRFASAIKHYGWDNFECEILHDNLTREEADELEVEYIKYYRDDLGIAYNIEDGGKSKGTHRNSEEVKRMISESMKGKNVGTNNGMHGKLPAVSKKVYEYDEEFNLINIHKAIQHATKNISISHATLSKHLYKHNLVRVCGKIFSFNEYNKEDILDTEPYNISLLTVPKIRNGKISIRQYDLGGNFIKEYETTKEAINTKLLSQTIIDKIREYPYEHNGYIWTRSDTNFDIFKDTKTNACLVRRDPMRCKINKYNINGNYICSYEYIKDIKEKENITIMVINRILNHLDKGPWIRDNIIWAKYDNTLEGDELVIAANINVANETQCKPIFQFDERGKLIGSFKSLVEIKNAYSLAANSYRLYIKNGPFKYKGYIWSDVDNLYPIESIVERSNGNEIVSKENMGRQVVQVDGDNIIKEYKNMSNLAKELGVNRHTLRLKLVKGEFIHNNLHYRYK